MNERMNARGDIAARTVRYFRQPGFRRILQAVWQKYASLGRIGGRAVVERANEQECEAVNLFFGWNCQTGESIAIPLEQFDRELRESAFAIDLPGLHLLLEGTPLLSRREREASREQNWRRLFAEVRESERVPPESKIGEWLNLTEQGAGAGSRTLLELYKASPEAARAELAIAVRALRCLPGGEPLHAPIRLPVLAARASGDAHALDPNRPAGRLLISALRSWSGTSASREPDPADADAAEGGDGSETLKLRELYRRFGIGDDDLSSIVHWCVPGQRQGQERGTIVQPTVWTLRQVDAEASFPRCSAVYIVENPAVFSAILDSLPSSLPERSEPAALLCTSGPASAAAIRWLHRCLEGSGAGCRLRYSGDFDVKGLAMGLSLQRLFPDRFTPWRFDADTYLNVAQRGRPGPRFDESELEKLKKMKVPWDEQLSDIMRRVGRKAHQESFVEELCGDFVRACRGRQGEESNPA